MYDSDDDVTYYCVPDKGKRLFGVELEMERSSRATGSAISELEEMIEGDAILKHECSIEDGCELVTRPMKIENQIKFWREVCPKIVGMGFRSYFTRRCGMHVHVTRSSLTSMTYGKLLVFVNHPTNQQFIRAVSKRTDRQFEQWSPFIRVSDRPSKSNEQNHECHDKFQAVGCREVTLEFRIFRGNLKLGAILGNLEFVDAVLMFCGETSIKRLGHRDFIGWVKERPNFKYLKQLLKEVKYA
jgi:hypothetical protein